MKDNSKKIEILTDAILRELKRPGKTVERQSVEVLCSEDSPILRIKYGSSTLGFDPENYICLADCTPDYKSFRVLCNTHI